MFGARIAVVMSWTTALAERVRQFHSGARAERGEGFGAGLEEADGYLDDLSFCNH